jgi:hypothetical protein
MAKITSLNAEIDVVVPGNKTETRKKAMIDINSENAEVTIKFALGAEARKQLIDVIVNAPDGVKAHLVAYQDGADI